MLITVSITVHLNANDMVRLRGYVNAATGQAAVYGNTAAYGFTYFNGALVY